MGKRGGGLGENRGGEEGSVGVCVILPGAKCRLALFRCHVTKYPVLPLAKVLGARDKVSV